MGRNAGDKTGLIDVATAQSVLKKSRRTVFYLVKFGKLTPIRVAGSKKTWFKADEVVGLLQAHQLIRSPRVNGRLEQHLRRYHPYLFVQPDPTSV